MHQHPIHTLHCFRQIADCVGIDSQGNVFLTLGTVHIGIGSTVDNQGDSVRIDKSVDSLGRGDIQLGDIGEEPLVVRRRRKQTHVRAQLSISPCDQNIHILRTVLRNR